MSHNEPKSKRGRVAEATIGIKLSDPTVEGLYVPQGGDSGRELPSVEKARASLSSCVVVLDNVQLSLERFTRDLAGVFAITIKGHPFAVYMTRNPTSEETRFYVRYSKTHETMHDLIPGLMDAANLRNNFHLQAPDGKVLFFSFVTKRHYMNLLSIADKSPVDKDTLAITDTRFDSTEDLKRKLSKAKGVSSNYMLFEFAEFVDSITFSSPIRTDTPHYYLETGDGTSYYLYVNIAPAPSERRKEMATFSYNGDTCVLYLEA
ncbi:MAG TPA: hypothetical protein VLD37_03960 [Candidatus Bilamarchaeum sp.]|nr:hypothetical protein [Candidatus Bilamarchaeum sp.]